MWCARRRRHKRWLKGEWERRGVEEKDERRTAGKKRRKKVFFFKQKTAYGMLRSLVGSEMCIETGVCV